MNHGGGAVLFAGIEPVVDQFFDDHQRPLVLRMAGLCDQLLLREIVLRETCKKSGSIELSAALQSLLCRLSRTAVFYILRLSPACLLLLFGLSGTLHFVPFELRPACETPASHGRAFLLRRPPAELSCGYSCGCGPSVDSVSVASVERPRIQSMATWPSTYFLEPNFRSGRG